MRPGAGIVTETILRLDRAVGAVFGGGRGALRGLVAQQMAPGDEQIGQRAAHQQAMGVFGKPAIAHLGKAEHPFDDPDRVLDFRSYFRFGAVFGALDQIDPAAVAVAAVGEVPGLGACRRITARWPR